VSLIDVIDFRGLLLFLARLAPGDPSGWKNTGGKLYGIRRTRLKTVNFPFPQNRAIT
jgi:hypothetical protein